MSVGTRDMRLVAMHNMLFCLFKYNFCLNNNITNLLLRGCSIITSRHGGKYFYTVFVILRDGKLGGWVVLKLSPWRHLLKFLLRSFA